MRDDRVTRVRGELRQLLGSGAFDIVEAALWVAAEEYDELDVERTAARVRLISAEGSRRAFDLANPFARLDVLRTYFFDELGFRGNEKEYNDPRNSFLSDVLDRRLGNPLTLSILFLDLAQAAGFAACGVGLPGHFVTRLTWDGRSLLVDPYHCGQVISEDDCRQLVSKTTGRPSLFRRELLAGADERSMLTRLLLNLKYIYVKNERGFLFAHLGQPGAAVSDLESYLAQTPGARDAESVRGRVAWLRQRLSEFN